MSSPPKSMSPSSARRGRPWRRARAGKLGLSAIVLEARDRVAAAAIRSRLRPASLRLGCGWLHSADRNSFVKIAEQLKFEIDKSRPPWREQGFDAVFPPRERADFIEALDDFFERAEEAAKAAATARPTVVLSRATAGTRYRRDLDYINGCELDRLPSSTLTPTRTPTSMAVRRGYGALMAAYARLARSH